MGEKFFALSIEGASHKKSGKPMQDYSVATKEDDYCIGVVCDGHGADKHFRSEIGSKTACLVAQDQLDMIAKKYSNWETIKENVHEIVHRLKLSIISNWQNILEEYTEKNPFTAKELEKASKSWLPVKDYDVGVPYGTTLLASLVHKDYYVVIMLGDGAIVKILPDDTVSNVVFPDKKVYDDAPHGATDSLCQPNAYDAMHIIIEPISDKEQGVTFGMCSDGLSEAYSSDSIFFKIILMFLNYFAEEGLEKSLIDIEEQFNLISAKSSNKDDISLAFATNHLNLYIKPEEIEEQNEEIQEETVSSEEEFTSDEEYSLEEEQEIKKEFHETKVENVKENQAEESENKKDVSSDKETILKEEEVEIPE